MYKKDLERHIKTHDDGQTPIACAKCKRAYIRKDTYVRHMKTAHKQEYLEEQRDMLDKGLIPPT